MKLWPLTVRDCLGPACSPLESRMHLDPFRFVLEPGQLHRDNQGMTKEVLALLRNVRGNKMLWGNWLCKACLEVKGGT